MPGSGGAGRIPRPEDTGFKLDLGGGWTLALATQASEASGALSLRGYREYYGPGHHNNRSTPSLLAASSFASATAASKTAAVAAAGSGGVMRAPTSPRMPRAL